MCLGISERKAIFFIWGIIAIFSFLYFKPFENDFPLPQFQTKDFFNKSYSEYFLYSLQLKQNTFPLWNPYNGGGVTPLANPAHTLFNPVNIIILKYLPFPLSLKFLYFIGLVIASSGAFLALRLLRAGVGSSLLGALFFLFSGSFVSQLGDFPYFQSVTFIPWVFWQSLRLRKNPSLVNILILGLFLSFQLISGPVDIWIFTAILAMSFSILEDIKKNKSLVGLFARFISAFIFSLVLSAIKLLPLGQLSFSPPRNLGYFYSLSYSLADIKSFIGFFEDVNISIYSGITTIIIFGAILILYRKRGLLTLRVPIYSLLVLIFLLLLVAPQYSPLYIFYLFPPFNLCSSPVIFVPFIGWFLAIFIVTGIEAISSLKNFRWLALFLGATLLSELSIFTYNSLPTKTTEKIRREIESNYPFLKPIEEAGDRVWLYNSGSQDNFYPFEGQNNVFWLIDSMNNPFLPSKRYYLYISLVRNGIEKDTFTNEITVSPLSQKLLSLQSVRYLVTPLTISNLELKTRNSDLNFYLIPNPAPKVRQVKSIVKADGLKEIVAQLSSDSFLASSSAIIEISKPNDRLAVFSQGYLNGLEMKIDNQTLPVYPVNLNQVGVFNKQDIDSPISFVFLPKSLALGRILSGTSVVGTIIYLLLKKLQFTKTPFF